MSLDVFGEEIIEVQEEPIYKRKKLSPFDFVKDLSKNKTNLLSQDPDLEKEFKSSAFLVNRAFSYYIDTILWANEINSRPNIDPKMAHDFYFYGLPSKSRFSKWSKEIVDDDLQLLIDHYNYSKVRAIEALNLLTDSDLEQIRESRRIGGRK